jgi:DNA-binding transcriptional regulator YhcF (GntR family)
MAQLQTKFKKGTFLVIPNKQAIMGMSPINQTIYFWICNFADDEGVCFPSVTKLAKCAGVSARTVNRAIKALEEKELLAKEQRFEQNRQTSNKYQILITGATISQPPHDTQSPSPLTNSRTELNPVITQSNELAEPSSAEVIALIDLFEPVNPAFNTWYANKTQRAACKWLLSNFDPPDLYAKIAALPKINAMPYAPITTTPNELQRNLSKITAFIAKIKNKQNNKGRGLET